MALDSDAMTSSTRPHKTRWVGCGFAAFALLAVYGTAVASGGDSVPITGKVQGTFASPSGCLGCGDMVRYVRADRVWCAWQGDNVIIHVRFRNSSVEHITIDWHPSYVIRGGGAHGEGFTSIQSSGVNAHASRGVFAKQKPKGVPVGTPIATCKPSFSTVESG
jgi:hypothetical protein